MAKRKMSSDSQSSFSLSHLSDKWNSSPNSTFTSLSDVEQNGNIKPAVVNVIPVTNGLRMDMDNNRKTKVGQQGRYYSNGKASYEINGEVPNNDTSPNEKEFVIPFDYTEIFHIIMYHLQDNALFKVHLPSLPEPPSFLNLIKEKITSIGRLSISGVSTGDEFCFDVWVTPVWRLLIKTSVVPFMFSVFIVARIILHFVSCGRILRLRIYCTMLNTFLLIIILSAQQLSTTAFSFLKCVRLGGDLHLLIEADVVCYQPWQILVFVYLTLFVLPFWLTLLIGPGLLRYDVISVNNFLLGLVCPAPVLIYWIYRVRLDRNNDAKESCPKMSQTCLLDEVWYSFKPFFGYKYLCWGGLVELRRLGLVMCATLINTQIAKIWSMMLVLLIGLSVHLMYRPYLDRATNVICNLSLLATLLVGVINAM